MRFFGYIMSEEINRDKKPSIILVAVLWVAVILVFALSAIISYQGMSLISVSESDVIWNGEIWEINPLFFWGGRLLGVVGSLLIWFLSLRKDFIIKIENNKNMHCIFVLLAIVVISIVSWWGSTFAVFLSTGFIDIQPGFADNAYIFNIPIYVFALISAADTVLQCKISRD